MLVTAVGIHSTIGQVMMLVLHDQTAAKKPTATTSANGNEAAEEEEKPEAEDAHRYKKKSVLQAKLTVLATNISKMGLTFAVLTTVVLTVRYCVRTYANEKKAFEVGQLVDFLDILTVAFTVLVVAIPEGLPLAVTLALAYSVRKVGHLRIRRFSTNCR